VSVSSSNGHALDAGGYGDCPLCGTHVRGEPGTLLTYWHTVESCRDALVVRLRAAEGRLRYHGLDVARYEGS
jgi:hypothetical protein